MLYTGITHVDMVLTLLVREGELVRIYLHSCMTCRGCLGPMESSAHCGHEGTCIV